MMEQFWLGGGRVLYEIEQRKRKALPQYAIKTLYLFWYILFAESMVELTRFAERFRSESGRE
jgi:hypothetical protein